MKISGLSNNIIINLLNRAMPQHLNLIISYLDDQSINDIIQAYKTYKQKPTVFQRLIQNRHFIQTYLTCTDRSIYVSYYSEPLYLKIEYQQNYEIISNSIQVLPYFGKQFSKVFENFRQQLSEYKNLQDFIQQIRLISVDTEIPFPKLRKDSVASHCNSSFQFFLTDKILKKDENSMDQQYSDELTQYLQQFQIESLRDDSEFSLFYEWMYSQWYKINHENYMNYFMVGNKNHNLVVIIIALVDLIADTYSFYVASIQDNLHSFVEFNMRYTIFRNIILSLEEKMGNLFKTYSLFCQNIIVKNSGKTANGRQMTVWNIALSKWYMRFHQTHQKNFNMMFYLLRKMNILSIKNENENIVEQDQSFVQLRNRLCLEQLQIINREEFFEIYSSVQVFMEENNQLYSQFVKEYIQYIFDLSINQYTVHWCGHSNQKLHKPYLEFQELFLTNFKSYVVKIIQFVKKVSNPALALDKTLFFLIEELDRQFLKPVTLKKLVFWLESQASTIIGKQIFKSTNLSASINRINDYLIDNDKKLEFYNNKNHIVNENMTQFSIILQTQDFNKQLKSSGSTKASRMNKSQRMKMLEEIDIKDSMIEEQS